jgi:hypothetical protein
MHARAPDPGHREPVESRYLVPERGRPSRDNNRNGRLRKRHVIVMTVVTRARTCFHPDVAVDPVKRSRTFFPLPAHHTRFRSSRRQSHVTTPYARPSTGLPRLESVQKMLFSENTVRGTKTGRFHHAPNKKGFLRAVIKS